MADSFVPLQRMTMADNFFPLQRMTMADNFFPLQRMTMADSFFPLQRMTMADSFFHLAAELITPRFRMFTLKARPLHPSVFLNFPEHFTWSVVGSSRSADPQQNIPECTCPLPDILTVIPLSPIFSNTYVPSPVRPPLPWYT